MNTIKTLLLGTAVTFSLATAAWAADPVALEVVISRPKAGATLEQVRANDKAVDAFVRAQTGFISREVGINKEGEMFVIVHWASLADAEAAGAAFMKDPSGAAAMSTGDVSAFKHFVVQ
jgi:hypothetical protein